MKVNSIFAPVTVVFLLACASITNAVDITAIGSGNWSSTVPGAPWPDGIVPSTNDDVDVESPYVITVDSNVTVQFIYGSGTVTLAPGTTLNIIGDPIGAYGTQELSFLNATAAGCTVNYSGNAFWAKRTDYFNLVFDNETTNIYNFYNGTIPGYGAVAMHIGGNMSVVGNVKVQEGADFTIGGNLLLGTNSTWDCSSFNLTVASNTTVGGLLLDLDGALGSNYFRGSLTVNATAIGWNISDVTQWGIGGSLTNNGTIVGKGYGCITFGGNGIITGSKSIKIPTMTVNGTYKIATTITLITNTPTLNGTLVFDLANTNQIVLLTNAGTALFYSGNLNVINSGATPASGASFKLFNAPSYDGAFTSTSFPSLPGGFSWVDNTLTTGSITVTGSLASPPVLVATRSGSLLTLSWDSAAYPGYSVQGQTNQNRAGVSTSWSATGSGTTSPFIVTINPSNGSVFFRLSKP
jgi:hypothetical protein